MRLNLILKTRIVEQSTMSEESSSGAPDVRRAEQDSTQEAIRKEAADLERRIMDRARIPLTLDASSRAAVHIGGDPCLFIHESALKAAGGTFKLAEDMELPPLQYNAADAHVRQHIICTRFQGFTLPATFGYAHQHAGAPWAREGFIVSAAFYTVASANEHGLSVAGKTNKAKPVLGAAMMHPPHVVRFRKGLHTSPIDRLKLESGAALPYRGRPPRITREIKDNILPWGVTTKLIPGIHNGYTASESAPGLLGAVFVAGEAAEGLEPTIYGVHLDVLNHTIAQMRTQEGLSLTNAVREGGQHELEAFDLVGQAAATAHLYALASGDVLQAQADRLHLPERAQPSGHFGHVLRLTLDWPPAAIHPGTTDERVLPSRGGALSIPAQYPDGELMQSQMPHTFCHMSARGHFWTHTATEGIVRFDELHVTFDCKLSELMPVHFTALRDGRPVGIPTDDALCCLAQAIDPLTLARYLSAEYLPLDSRSAHLGKLNPSTPSTRSPFKPSLSLNQLVEVGQRTVEAAIPAPIDQGKIAEVWRTIANEYARGKPTPDTDHVRSLFGQGAGSAGRSETWDTASGNDALNDMRRLLNSQNPSELGEHVRLRLIVDPILWPHLMRARNTALGPLAPLIGKLMPDASWHSVDRLLDMIRQSKVFAHVAHELGQLFVNLAYHMVEHAARSGIMAARCTESAPPGASPGAPPELAAPHQQEWQQILGATDSDRAYIEAVRACMATVTVAIARHLRQYAAVSREALHLRPEVLRGLHHTLVTQLHPELNDPHLKEAQDTIARALQLDALVRPRAMRTSEDVLHAHIAPIQHAWLHRSLQGTQQDAQRSDASLWALVRSLTHAVLAVRAPDHNRPMGELGWSHAGDQRGAVEGARALLMLLSLPLCNEMRAYVTDQIARSYKGPSIRGDGFDEHFSAGLHTALSAIATLCASANHIVVSTYNIQHLNIAWRWDFGMMAHHRQHLLTLSPSPALNASPSLVHLTSAFPQELLHHNPARDQMPCAIEADDLNAPAWLRALINDRDTQITATDMDEHHALYHTAACLLLDFFHTHNLPTRYNELVTGPNEQREHAGMICAATHSHTVIWMDRIMDRIKNGPLDAMSGTKILSNMGQAHTLTHFYIAGHLMHGVSGQREGMLTPSGAGMFTITDSIQHGARFLSTAAHLMPHALLPACQDLMATAANILLDPTDRGEQIAALYGHAPDLDLRDEAIKARGITEESKLVPKPNVMQRFFPMGAKQPIDPAGKASDSCQPWQILPVAARHIWAWNTFERALVLEIADELAAVWEDWRIDPIDTAGVAPEVLQLDATWLRQAALILHEARQTEELLDLDLSGGITVEDALRDAQRTPELMQSPRLKGLLALLDTWLTTQKTPFERFFTLRGLDMTSTAQAITVARAKEIALNESKRLSIRPGGDFIMPELEIYPFYTGDRQRLAAGLHKPRAQVIAHTLLASLWIRHRPAITDVGVQERLSDKLFNFPVDVRVIAAHFALNSAISQDVSSHPVSDDLWCALTPADRGSIWYGGGQERWELERAMIARATRRAVVQQAVAALTYVFGLDLSAGVEHVPMTAQVGSVMAAWRQIRLLRRFDNAHRRLGGMSKDGDVSEALERMKEAIQSGHPALRRAIGEPNIDLRRCAPQAVMRLLINVEAISNFKRDLKAIGRTTLRHAQAAHLSNLVGLWSGGRFVARHYVQRPAHQKDAPPEPDGSLLWCAEDDNTVGPCTVCGQERCAYIMADWLIRSEKTSCPPELAGALIDARSHTHTHHAQPLALGVISERVGKIWSQINKPYHKASFSFLPVRHKLTADKGDA